MPTPSSASTAYASAADMAARYDVRTLGQLCSDTGTPISSGSLSSSERMTAALAGASGMVEAAVTAAGTYAPADLAALTGVSLAYLKDLVCALALGRLFLARPDREGKAPEACKLAVEELTRLRQGEWSLGLVEQRDAGKISVDEETSADVEARNGIVVECQRLFSRRNNRLHG